VDQSASAPIRHVSDTALWVAIYRAMETERPDAIFRDPWARRMGGARGEAIVRHLPGGKRNAWPMIVRTAVMDELILRCVRDGAGTVVNLAAGLDTRPFRLDLPPSLRWLHVDLPDMVAYVREHLDGAKPRCRLEFVEADLTDAAAREAALARAGEAGPVLAVTEGLLIYLAPADVGALARELHGTAQARWWITDIATPLLAKYLGRTWGSRLRDGNAPMRFFPPEGAGFFAPFGWREAEFRSTWDEALRLKRTMPLVWLWKLLSKLQPRERHEAGRRMSGTVLLERT